MVSIPSAISKITRPVPVEAFPRKRLFHQLDRVRKCPIVWVCGPPGCGKTTLISDYISTRGDPCLWYRVDEGDQNIASFFYYMGLAAKKAAPRKRRALPFFTPEYYMGIPTFTRRYFEELYSRIKSQRIGGN